MLNVESVSGQLLRGTTNYVTCRLYRRFKNMLLCIFACCIATTQCSTPCGDSRTVAETKSGENAWRAWIWIGSWRSHGAVEELQYCSDEVNDCV